MFLLDMNSLNIPFQSSACHPWWAKKPAVFGNFDAQGPECSSILAECDLRCHRAWKGCTCGYMAG